MDQLFRFDAAEPIAAVAAANEVCAAPPPFRLAHAEASQAAPLLDQPAGIVVLPNGKLCVASEGSGRVVAFSAEGKLIKQPAKIPTFLWPSALIQDGTSLFVADAGTHQVVRLALKDLCPACVTAGNPGDGPGQLQGPRGLALIGNALFVSDCNNHRIVRFHHRLLEPMGEPFGCEGSDEGCLRYPRGLAVIGEEHARSHEAELVVADTQNHRLQFFAADGTFLRAIGRYGRRPGEFDEPVGVATGRGAILVAEQRRVQVLDATDWSPQQLISMGDHVVLGGIALGRQRAYATDVSNGGLVCFAVTGGAPLPQAIHHAAGDVVTMDVSGAAVPDEISGRRRTQRVLAADASSAAQQPPPPPVAPPVASSAESVVATLESPDLLSCLLEAMQLGGFLPAASVCHLWADVARAKAKELSLLTWTRSLGAATAGADETSAAASAATVADAEAASVGAGVAVDAEMSGAASPPSRPPVSFSHPTHVSALCSGGLVVAECATSQLVVVTEDGTLMNTVGSKGRGPSDLHGPRGVLVCDGCVVIADSLNHRLQKRQITLTADGVGSLGSVLANSDGAADLDDGSGGLQRPDGLARHAGELYVTDKAAHTVRCHDVHTLQLKWEIGSKGDGDGQLCDPGGVDVHEHEGAPPELVVADIANHRLSLFTLEGAFTRTLGRRGHAPGCFQLPSAVVSARGRLVVAERRRVQVITGSGVPLQVVTPPNCGSLYGLCLTSSGRHLVVCDYEARELHEFALR